jgi:hypothetical protein
MPLCIATLVRYTIGKMIGHIIMKLFCTYGRKLIKPRRSFPEKKGAAGKLWLHVSEKKLYRFIEP